MKNYKKIFIPGLLLGIALLTSSSIPIFPCHGLNAWRFLPYEKAVAALAKLKLEQKKRVETLPPVSSPEQETWFKYYNNPIFKIGLPNSWEGYSVDCFSILSHEKTYWMWYVGTPDIPGGAHCQIGLATSKDGINWTRCLENPVIKVGPPGSWDASILLCQQMLFDDEERIFKTWYVGGSYEGVYGIGYATSPDGIHWTKYGRNPIMTITDAWEGVALEGQCVMKTAGGYKMWYGGFDFASDTASIGYATSQDGIHWIKYQNNPVLTPAEGTPKKWDGYAVDTPDVFFEGGIYHMYYRGWKKRDGVSWIGYAVSKDGIHWERDADNPVLMTSDVQGAWDNYQLYRSRIMRGEVSEENPSAIRVDQMYFTGRSYSRIAQVGLAYRLQNSWERRNIREKIPQLSQDQMELVLETTATGSIDIYYFTPWLGPVSLTIYNQSGQKIKTLTKEIKLPGIYKVTWDQRDARKKIVPNGLYFCELAAEKYIITKEIALVR
jgi:predicted GH43/DUF377 family glycosyl hydrolase